MRPQRTVGPQRIRDLIQAEQWRPQRMRDLIQYSSGTVGPQRMRDLIQFRGPHICLRDRETLRTKHTVMCACDPFTTISNEDAFLRDYEANASRNVSLPLVMELDWSI